MILCRCITRINKGEGDGIYYEYVVSKDMNARVYPKGYTCYMVCMLYNTYN